MGFPFCSTLRVPGGQLLLHTDTGTWHINTNKPTNFQVCYAALRREGWVYCYNVCLSLKYLYMIVFYIRQTVHYLPFFFIRKWLPSVFIYPGMASPLSEVCHCPSNPTLIAEADPYHFLFECLRQDHTKEGLYQSPPCMDCIFHDHTSAMVGCSPTSWWGTSSQCWQMTHH